MRLKDRVAIVTGGGSGIGKAIALLFAAEGAKVVVASRTLSNLEAVVNEVKSNGGEAMAIPTDVSDEKQVQRLVAGTIDKYGQIDILVNASAFMQPDSIPVAEMPLDYWKENLAVTLTGTMLCIREAVRYMIERKQGSIVNISSMAGVAGLPNKSAYTAAKWAVIGFTESLAIEVGKYGIRANCISPAATRTEKWEAGQQARAERTGIPREKSLEEMLVRYPLKKVAQPSEMASAALFLASDDASAVTGINLIVSCGFHMVHAG
jgi:NAD(P)-dependent dehydrogenase (short-subunit alcohol dehydrogenase family)